MLSNHLQILALLAIAVAFFNGCRGSLEADALAGRPSAIPPLQTSSDGELKTRLKIGDGLWVRLDLRSEKSRYELMNDAGEALASGESLLTQDQVIDDRFYGTQHVAFNSDHSLIVIRDEASDGIPAIRFIAFEAVGDQKYRTRYLLPPVERWHPTEPTAFAAPYILSIQDGVVSLYFEKKNSVLEVPLTSIEQSVTPRNDF